MPPSNPPQASLSGLLFPGQDSWRLTYNHPAGFLTYGLARSREEEGRESVGGASTGRGVAQTWPLGLGSPVECALGSRPPDCIPFVVASPASKCWQEGSGKLGLGVVGCPGRAPALRPQLEGRSIRRITRVVVQWLLTALIKGVWRKLCSLRHSVSIGTTEKRLLSYNCLDRLGRKGC